MLSGDVNKFKANKLGRNDTVLSLARDFLIKLSACSLAQSYLFPDRPVFGEPIFGETAFSEKIFGELAMNPTVCHIKQLAGNIGLYVLNRILCTLVVCTHVYNLMDGSCTLLMCTKLYGWLLYI